MEWIHVHKVQCLLFAFAFSQNGPENKRISESQIESLHCLNKNSEKNVKNSFMNSVGNWAKVKVCIC